MPRPALAAKASRPAPLMAAAGTEAARRKSVPRGAASVVKIFRIMAVRAVPAIGFARSPLAQWATNTAEINCFFFKPADPGGFLRLEGVLEDPER